VKEFIRTTCRRLFGIVKRLIRANATAQHNLGLCYFEGEGVPQDNEQAAAWFVKRPIRATGMRKEPCSCYSEGVGVQQDNEQAAAWYRKAADQGDADAQRNLGSCYSEGEEYHRITSRRRLVSQSG